ncbi:MAG: hypothetical protein QE263_00795 [Vampirovibrionales bacterium]|nr:hypothetical protein [Vampirovibrionales bacterium]
MRSLLFKPLALTFALLASGRAFAQQDTKPDCWKTVDSLEQVNLDLRQQLRRAKQENPKPDRDGFETTPAVRAETTNEPTPKIKKTKVTTTTKPLPQKKIDEILTYIKDQHSDPERTEPQVYSGKIAYTKNDLVVSYDPSAKVFLLKFNDAAIKEIKDDLKKMGSDAVLGDVVGHHYEELTDAVFKIIDPGGVVLLKTMDLPQHVLDYISGDRKTAAPRGGTVTTFVKTYILERHPNAKVQNIQFEWQAP